MSFRKAIKELFGPTEERHDMAALPSRAMYQHQIDILTQNNHDLQNQLAATHANQQMMKAMLQQQQIQPPQSPQPGNLQQAINQAAAQAARPQAWGGAGGAAYEMKYKPSEPETKKHAKMLEKLLEAKI